MTPVANASDSPEQTSNSWPILPEKQINIEHEDEVLRAPVNDGMQPQEISPGGGAVEQNNIELEVARGRQANDHMQLQWRLLIIEICFTAIGIAVQAFQAPNPLLTSIQFRCFRMVMMFSFAALLISVYVRRYSESVALIFEHIGVFFAAMAFVLAVTIH